MEINAGIIARLGNDALMASPYPDPRFPPSPYYRFLKLLAEHMQSRLSVELGVSGGGGSLHLALGNREGQAVGIDIAYNEHRENIEYIEKTCPNFIFLEGDSVDLAQYVYAIYGEIDILFIDTTHTYEQTMKEYNAYQSHLSDRAVVCLDDLFRPGMREAWEKMPEPKLRLDSLHQAQNVGQLGDGGFGVVF